MGRGDKGVRISILTEFDPKGAAAAEKRFARLAETVLANSKTMEGGMVRAGHAMQTFGSSLSRTGDTLTRSLTVPIGLAAAASVKMASDVSEAANKVDVVFEGAAESVKAFADQGAEALGMSERAALESAGTFGNLLTAAGLAEAQAATMSTTMVALARDMASFNNASPEEVLEALRSGLSGETEPLKKFGVNLNEATLKAKALELGIYNGVGVLTAAQKAQAAYAVVLEQTTKAQGDFARTSDGLANQSRIIKAELEDAAASIGENLLPIAADLAKGVSDLTGKFNELSPEGQKTVIMLAGAAAAIGPLLSGTGRLINSVGAITTMLGKASAAQKAYTAAVAAGEPVTASATAAIWGMHAAQVAAAGAVGYLIGSLYNQIPAAKRSADALAEAAGEADNFGEYMKLAGEREREWTDYAFPALAGTQQLAGMFGFLAGNVGEVAELTSSANLVLDENGVATAESIATLKARNDALREQSAATESTSAATNGLTQTLNAAEEAVRGLMSAQDEAESADIRYERSQLRLIDAEKAYTDAVKKHGAGSREAKDAELDLRQARLDNKAATDALAESTAAVAEAIANIPMPNSKNKQAWVDYYKAIGDKAGYAAAQANAANRAIVGGNAKSNTGGYNVPVYGHGTFATYEHLAVVGDVPEIIFPLGDAAFAAEWLPTLLKSLPSSGGSSAPVASASAPASGIGGAYIAPGAITINLPPGSDAQTAQAAGSGVLAALALEIGRG